MVAPQPTNCDWLKFIAKTVAKHNHQNQTINTTIVNDQYLIPSMKTGTRLTCEQREIPQRVSINDFDQNMLSGTNCALFFKNPDNKEYLISWYTLISKQISRDIYMRFH